ncbi:MAG TPA: cobalamin biosynthesis protein CbiN [Methanosarcinaceae archaeon]|nr:cobalamin biosynthesis protein CbiN [Methanosarcinaceae archaeon]
MNKKTNADAKKILLAGLIIGVVISVLAPFLASSDPDGLESAAEGIVDPATFAELEESEPFMSSPMPDYSIEGFGKLGEVGAIVIGTLLMLVLGYGVGKIIKG